MSLYARLKEGNYNAVEELGVLAKTSKVNTLRLYQMIKKGGCSSKSADLASCAIGEIFNSDPEQIDIEKILKGLSHKKPEIRLRAGNAINYMVGYNSELMSRYVPKIISAANNPKYTDSLAGTTEQMIAMYSRLKPQALVPYVFELFTNKSREFNGLHRCITDLLLPKLSNELLKESLKKLIAISSLTIKNFAGDGFWADKSLMIKPNFLIDNSEDISTLLNPFNNPMPKKSDADLLRVEGKILIENIAKRLNPYCPSKPILDVFEIKPSDFAIKLYGDNEIAIYSPAKMLSGETGSKKE